MAAVLALRLAEPVGRRLSLVDGKRSEILAGSLMHWLILKVYGPWVALVATAAVPCFEAIVQRAGIGAAGIGGLRRGEGRPGRDGPRQPARLAQLAGAPRRAQG